MPRIKKDRGSCKNCGNKLINVQISFCCGKCVQEFRYTKYINEWKQGLRSGGNDFNISPHVRHYLFEKFGSKCCCCGWCEVNPTSGKIPLEVEHIDGNWRNNTEENLSLLCPNFHSLTPTYRGLNKGNGRHTNLIKKNKSTFGKPGADSDR